MGVEKPISAYPLNWFGASRYVDHEIVYIYKKGLAYLGGLLAFCKLTNSTHKTFLAKYAWALLSQPGFITC